MRRTGQPRPNSAGGGKPRSVARSQTARRSSMMTVPRKVRERLSSGLKRYQPVLAAAQSRDLNESDTSMIVSDMLAEVFGYDKYTEVTRELCIRGTFCDLALRIDEKFQLLVEVKAIGTELKDPHVKQVVDYAANQGIEWVALT